MIFENVKNFRNNKKERIQNEELASGSERGNKHGKMQGMTDSFVSMIKVINLNQIT